MIRSSWFSRRGLLQGLWYGVLLAIPIWAILFGIWLLVY